MTLSVGSTVPTSSKLAEGAPDKTVTLPTSGKYVLVAVPAAFSPSCSNQVPGYLEKAETFKEKGYEIYVVSVNDTFVMEAWKEKLGGGKSGVHFVADATGDFTKQTGLLFDASGLLGNHRSNRYVAVVEDDKVKHFAVEASPPDVKETSVEKTLAAL
ncbi:thioredoxin-like protein [Protomyces lactucae-debilis]|uniref:Thioredoxin-like protein n=1 Tax=Protomyces lactucae-debilis TaxID=2754530 RepID=A0A1Y2EXJ8_PROLT|nr:thioredoxin-like protein [Protomyces lactucae-debilis]ORY76319.1 thioredoxin-like protein [Protomyces lactucae-debilis]